MGSVPHGPYRRAAALAAAAVISLLTLTACAVAADAASTPTAAPTATPVPEPAPPAVRPVNVTGTTCATFIPVERLEAAAGTALIPGGLIGSEFDGAAYAAWWESAGGFSCRWSDAATGETRVAVSVLPSGASAGIRILEEFAELEGSETIGDLRPLEAGCGYDYCSAKGYVGDDFANVTVMGTTPNEDGEATPELLAVRDAAAAALAAMPADVAIPPLTAAWADGPRSCEELIAPDALADALGAGSTRYAIGYAMEEASGSDAALLTAGGFSCRVLVDDSAWGARIAVLPDAETAFAAASALPGPEAGPIPGALEQCRSNGPEGTESSLTCSVDLLAGGGWVMITTSDYLGGDIVRERARSVASAVADALEGR